MPELIRAAGAVLWRDSPDGEEIALVHRPRYDDWSLPKGKLEPDEPEAVAAVREVREETGFHGPLGRGLGRSRYEVVVAGRVVPKEVRWWAMEATDGSFTANDEVDDLLWVSGSEAVQRLDPDEAAPLERFLSGPRRTTTVLLVRHASAGRRAAGDDLDDERPLDERGRRQAAVLARVLPLWRPTRIVSAPPLRCRQTVEAVGGSEGIHVEAALGEHAGDLEGALEVLRTLGRRDSASVASGQGGLIPQLVARLTAGGPGAAPCGKGSTWALSFGPNGDVVDADHTAGAD